MSFEKTSRYTAEQFHLRLARCAAALRNAVPVVQNVAAFAVLMDDLARVNEVSDPPGTRSLS